MRNLVLGVDIGGSHITTALVDLSLGQLLRETIKRKALNSLAVSEEVINSWVDAIEEGFNGYAGPKRIGIAMPGPFDYQEGISYIKGLQKYDSLYGINVKVALANKLGIKSDAILFENDAACFLQGEIFAGAAKGFRKSIGFTLGTGFGSAIGMHMLAQDAEFWNRPFLTGIAEDYFSTKWFLKRYEELSGKFVANVQELVRQYSTCHLVKQVFHEFSHHLSDFSEQIFSLYEPDVIVIGGNISRASDLFLEQLITHFKNLNKELVIRASLLGEESAIIGGASLWTR